MGSRKRVKAKISKKHLFIISLVVILVVLGILGYFFLLKNKLKLNGYNSKITLNYKTDFKKANFNELKEMLKKDRDVDIEGLWYETRAEIEKL